MPRPSSNTAKPSPRDGRPEGLAPSFPAALTRPNQPPTTYRPMTSATAALDRLKRSPQRVSVTLNAAIHQRLIHRADDEGRSLSNLIAFLLETAMGRPS